MNTEDLVSKKREKEIYRERNKARRAAGGVGPLSRYDFGVGFRAALAELRIGEIVEVTRDCAGCKHDCGFVDHPLSSCGLNGDDFCPSTGAVLVRVAEAAGSGSGAPDAPPKA